MLLRLEQSHMQVSRSDSDSLGLCPSSALVCDLLSRIGVYLVISWKNGPHRSGVLC